jgi:3-oxoadipyl-CoA thiolase
MTEAYLCDGVRTPFGRQGGALAHVRADDLASVPIQALSTRYPDLTRRLDEVFLGCANQAGEDNRNVARMALLLAGLPPAVPGVTVNRLCASGLEAIGQAARAIRAGDIDLAIAGGVENMSRAPVVMARPEYALPGDPPSQDTTLGWRFINPAMRQAYGVDSMPQTAETVAREFGISRADQDAFALRSQQRAAEAIRDGFFAQEITPVGAVVADEHPRPATTLEKLAALKPIVHVDGTVTAGNASGINDGAAAMIVASAQAADALGLRKRARVLSMASGALEPRIMGIGPIPATEMLLDRIGLTMGEFDVIELNEAFASQALAVMRHFGLQDDDARVNANGGAIALGHPLGASGARLVITGLNQLERTGGRYGLATLCVGVGQGLSLAYERV